MFELSTGIYIVLFLVLAAEFVNGWTDAPNAMATVVSTRVLSPYKAVIMVALLNFLGTFSGTAVAFTIGKGIVNQEIINPQTVAAAMIAIVLWSTIAWYWGLPTSETHALVAGLAGAGLAVGGPSVLLWEGWRKVIIGLIFSTFLGFSGGLAIMTALYWGLRKKTPTHVNRVFGKLQILSSAFMAFGHGSNDGQKFMGVFALVLVMGGAMPEFRIPIGVIVVCAVVMGIGTACGGWRIVKTIGLRLT
ncbi:MAG: inorganic phosphate transporter, partial [Candidatus Stahlbacteria bacterium]|nr:inorganic phosphate transporter [Candidatus Stahlbacteria bacterium]